MNIRMSGNAGRRRITVATEIKMRRTRDRNMIQKKDRDENQNTC